MPSPSAGPNPRRASRPFPSSTPPPGTCGDLPSQTGGPDRPSFAAEPARDLLVTDPRGLDNWAPCGNQWLRELPSKIYICAKRTKEQRARIKGGFTMPCTGDITCDHVIRSGNV